MNTGNGEVLTVVVIGLNEEDHLQASIDGIFASMPRHREVDVLYVDSGSSDRSVEIARSIGGVRVLHLDCVGPSAAKARNLGMRHVRGSLVQLIDGDSVIQPGWFDAALSCIEQNPEVACVFGQCIEMHPDQSVYMKVCGLDWHIPAGQRRYCGGNALWRTATIASHKGFDESLRFGEEPDLCYRVRQGGGKIMCLDVPMVTHDLGMVRFGQYWKRAMNSGEAYARISSRYFKRPEKLWLRETLINFAEPLFWILITTVSAMAFGLPAALAFLGAWWFLRATQIAFLLRGRGVGVFHALLYGLHCQFVRIPLALGQFASFARI